MDKNIIGAVVLMGALGATAAAHAQNTNGEGYLNYSLNVADKKCFFPGSWVQIRQGDKAEDYSVTAYPPIGDPKGVEYEAGSMAIKGGGSFWRISLLEKWKGGTFPKSPDCTDAGAYGSAYQVPRTTLDNAASHGEYVIGAAVIPFKNYLGGSKNLNTNSSVVGYFGYRWHNAQWNAQLIPAFVAGVSSNTVDATAGTGGTQQSGLTLGVGLYGQLGSGGAGSKSQFGFVLGWDHVSDSLNWVNNNVPWIGFQLGAELY